MNYSSAETALPSLKNIPAVRGYPTGDDDEFLINLLNASKGTDKDGLPHYRLWYVAARFLQQPTAIHALSSAEGAKFTELLIPIASLFQLQASEDLALGLTIPSGYEVNPSDALPADPTARIVRSLPFGSFNARVASVDPVMCGYSLAQESITRRLC